MASIIRCSLALSCLLAASASFADDVQGLRGRDLQESYTCSSQVSEPGPVTGTTNCESFEAGSTYDVDDFEYPNKFAWYTCPESKLRIAISNGAPDHEVTQGNPNSPCEQKIWIEMPLDPVKTSTQTEPIDLGYVGLALNGVLIYGALEGGGTNAAEPASDASITDAQDSWGHAAPTGDWHYHNPMMGFTSYKTDTDLLAYALDGFPIYGPVDDDSELDACNMDSDNKYHVRTLEQVDGTGAYCSGSSAAVNWNYMLGCFWGDTSLSTLSDAAEKTLPDDCVLDEALGSNNLDDLCSGDNVDVCGETSEGMQQGIPPGMMVVGGGLFFVCVCLCVGGFGTKLLQSRKN